AQEPHVTGVRVDKPKQEPDGRGLARTIGPEEAEDTSFFDNKVETVERSLGCTAKPAIRLAQPDDLDDSHGATMSRTPGAAIRLASRRGVVAVPRETCGCHRRRPRPRARSNRCLARPSCGQV